MPAAVASAPFPNESIALNFTANAGATTDAAGEATIYGFATHNFGIAAGSSAGGVNRSSPTQSVDATSDTSVTLTLPELVTVSGVLRTAGGQPVPGVFMRFSGQGGSSGGETGSDGSYSLQAVAGNDSLSFEGGGKLTPESLHLPQFFEGSLLIDAEQNIEHEDIVLPQVVAVTATVKDARGNPVEGAQVSGGGAAVAYATASAVLMLLLIVRGFEYPEISGRTAPWYTQPGVIAGIPAIPWLMPTLMGALLLRRAGDAPPTGSFESQAPNGSERRMPK